MRSRGSEARPGILHREANGVIDRPLGDFIVTNETRENWEACGIGAGPGVGAPLVGSEIPHGARSCVPIRGLRIRTIQFVEETSVGVENQDVAIAAAGIGVAFNGGGKRNRHRASVALAAVCGVVDRQQGL